MADFKRRADEALIGLTVSVSLTRFEAEVLLGLSYQVEDGWFLSFTGVADRVQQNRETCGHSKPEPHYYEIRSACQRLALLGLAVYRRGLMDEDGIPAGSGYAATMQGRALIRRASLRLAAVQSDFIKRALRAREVA